ncbi:MAG: Na+/H+ antiporter NhaC family protein [Gammaproteobacteria bacterium]|nr:Na+/H+ antiporter NhaC family protein [Gammaproteobacteria bacterium]MDH4253047.1 Na+/H+ antiporter NhaC family protein [Gammaproteobacteria bacterium]MDH5308531.1 Na+/H+ antiporter NhaC family protein [Gammaproteobacteria bacterium]
MLTSPRARQLRDKNIKKLILTIVLLLSAAVAHGVEIHAPAVALTDVPARIEVRGALAHEVVELQAGGSVQVVVADAAGVAAVELVFPATGAAKLTATTGSGASAEAGLRILPAWVSVTPPLLAILIALTLRSVIPALMLGIWLGAAALQPFTPLGIFNGLLTAFQVYVVRALADPDHAAIILFSLMIGGMVGIITRNGGMARIVTMIVSRARTAVAGQVSVWLMGLMIFFDDYSNTLVVGNTARPLTDHLRISREKLAYIVDSTAAPVVCLALITTWIGYEVGLIDAALSGIPDLNEPAYTVFLRSIPYSFYPLLAVVFVLAVAATGRDMGPMYHAELRARRGQVSPVDAGETPALQGDQLEPKADVPMRAANAFVPLAVLIVALLGGLYVTGEGNTLTDIIGSADAYKAMMWASLLSALTAGVMTVGQRILSTHETVDAWFGGVRAMLFAMIILILAWALSNITEDLHTADYLVSILADSLRPELVPAAVFLLSAATAFTTGTSWGTMGILMPLVVPLCWAVLQFNGMTGPEHLHILYSAVACNLAGAVWGDHCSPISDTTVLSSMASGCDHIEHVRTQMPYAVLVGGVALLLGTIPGGFGLSPLLSLPLGAGLLFAVLRYYGNRADDEA